MSISLVAILASLFGTLFGATVATWLSFGTRRDACRGRLRLLLFKNGYEIWWPNGREPWQIIEDSRIEIHAEYLSLRSLTFQRRRLDNAWAAYTGVKHYHQLADYEPGKLFAKSAVSRDEAIARTIDFIKAIA